MKNRWKISSFRIFCRVEKFPCIIECQNSLPPAFLIRLPECVLRHRNCRHWSTPKGSDFIQIYTYITNTVLRQKRGITRNDDVSWISSNCFLGIYVRRRQRAFLSLLHVASEFRVLKREKINSYFSACFLSFGTRDCPLLFDAYFFVALADTLYYAYYVSKIENIYEGSWLCTPSKKVVIKMCSSLILMKLNYCQIEKVSRGYLNLYYLDPIVPKRQNQIYTV